LLEFHLVGEISLLPEELALLTQAEEQVAELSLKAPSLVQYIKLSAVGTAIHAAHPLPIMGEPEPYTRPHTMVPLRWAHS